MSRNWLIKKKDGGSESPVDAYFLFEIKGLLSIALLRFNKGRREAFHSHAFDAYTWFLSGNLVEEDVSGEEYIYTRNLLVPKVTLREKMHRVRANEDSWCFTIRGAWQDTWKEYNQETKETTVFTHGREVLSVTKEI